MPISDLMDCHYCGCPFFGRKQLEHHIKVKHKGKKSDAYEEGLKRSRITKQRQKAFKVMGWTSERGDKHIQR